MIRRAVFAVALLAALPALAQIYNWKDKDGRVHYGDTPPPTGEVSVIRGTPMATPAVAPAPPPESAGTPGATDTSTAPQPSRPPTLAERERAFRERRAAEAEAQAKTEEEATREAERQRFCEQARNQIGALESGQRVSRFNAAGEREFLDDAARSAELARLQQQLAEHCQ
ncbi:DUF4124 domain-containing protein [Thauera sp.]|jgi:type IV secretory pathway VirB10-like protein|uniref:DUF4124 domain-containing protein n=1 Tax=Thauera sp. TaxID=1905334 RepID=UPI002A36664B|nr:DUF4124 domain-containing protein [Thauera sp.]MDX9885185.1 DUF4124 domain-containing protein [Thauera sp.]